MIDVFNFNENTDSVFTEAVFAGGKQTMKPVVDQFQVIKDILEKSVNDQKANLKKFDPVAFWRNIEWKNLEDIIQKQFGLRVCKINSYNEKYIAEKDIFESKEINAYVYRRTRYPVEGLITEKGFFDKSHSIDLDMYISLGAIRTFTAGEIVAIMLHEFGHSIDPALVDIKYTGTNILCKYITDRKNAINKEEKTFLAKETKDSPFLSFLSMISGKVKDGVKSILNGIANIFKKKDKSGEVVTEGFVDIFGTKNAREKDKLKKIQKLLEKNSESFNRKDFTEAFADNFARMYGFGPEMASALKKCSKDVDDRISRMKKERERETVIFNMTMSAITDVHKTDVHRIKALIKEYYDDINDPNTPAEIKKQLQADVKEVETILDQFTNDFSDFQNRINKLISDEIDKIKPDVKTES